MEKIAHNILAQVKAMVPGRFETVLATERTHPHVDWKAYYAVREKAGALGFQYLGDVDVTSVHQDPSFMKRAVLAVFAGDDGTNVLGHYRLALRWTVKGILARFMGGRGDIFDIGTNFGGGQGVMLQTTTAEASAVWDMPDFILRETLPHGTALDVAVQRHRERVQDYRRQHSTARPTAVHTLRDVFAISDIMERRKAVWRRDLGWATRDELARLSKLSGPAVDQLYEAFQNAAREGDDAYGRRAW
jgi:hypothetical protein